MVEVSLIRESQAEVFDVISTSQSWNMEVDSRLTTSSSRLVKTPNNV